MTRTSFMVGISAIAFAAGAANAQTPNGDTTDTATGNRVVASCTAGNFCEVDQGATGDTFNSTGSANASGGTGNTATVIQRGNRQFSEVQISGSRNEGEIQQNQGFSNSASIAQTGTIGTGLTANFAFIDQGQDATANGNSARIVQQRTAGAADAAGLNYSEIDQEGSSNIVNATQVGTGLFSDIRQHDDGLGLPRNNVVTVVQTGRGGVASTGTDNYVHQEANGNTANVGLYDGGLGDAYNTSDIYQSNTYFLAGSGGAPFTAGTPSGGNSPNTGNLATVAITGQGNDSIVDQDGVQNTADVSMLNGGAGNTSSATGGTNPGTGVSLTAGGQPGGRQEGNEVDIEQDGRGNYAAVSSGGRAMYSNGTMSAGAGNIATITQLQDDAGVTAQTFRAASSYSGATPTQAHYAVAYQRGTLDTVEINQENNTLGTGGATQSGSIADVSQLSFNSSVTVDQEGSNTALVTQGSRSEPTNSDNLTIIDQVDAGDVAGSGSGGGGFGGGTPGAATQRNFTEVVQYGIQNSASVTQNAIGASATVFQAVGTRQYSAFIEQGVGAPIIGSFSAEQDASAAADAGTGTQNVSARINQESGNPGAGAGAGISQSGINLFATITQRGGTAVVGTGAQTPSGNLALVAQANTNNSVTVSQNGIGLSAEVEQRGSGGASLLNLVTITQSGGSAAAGNFASATQTENVGASTSSGATAGVLNDVNFPNSRSGANSAEIVIAQSGTGGSATVEQRGKGQYASITQSGSGNTAGILQDTGATNAVAIINQSGSTNTYYVNQTLPGQYIRVTQTGTSNAVTQVVNGPSGNGGGSTTTVPTFGGVQ